MNARWITLQNFSLVLIVLLGATRPCLAASARVKVPKNEVINAPEPEYPHDAQLRFERGSGVFLLRTKIHTGRVTQVIIGQTTGYKSLDDAAVKAFSRWLFKPDVLIHRDITKPRLTPPISADECLVLVPVTFRR